MNNTIYKYPLVVTDFQEVLLPVGAEILTVQAQGDIACMWVLVNPNETQHEAHRIELFGTGNPIGCGIGVSRKYISTLQMHGGQFVFHAFEYTGV